MDFMKKISYCLTYLPFIGIIALLCRSRSAYDIIKKAGVSELADEVDSKSISGNGVRVQVPPPALENDLWEFC